MQPTVHAVRAQMLGAYTDFFTPASVLVLHWGRFLVCFVSESYTSTYIYMYRSQELENAPPSGFYLICDVTMMLHYSTIGRRAASTN